MKITLNDMIERYFDSDSKQAADALNMTHIFLNNLILEGRKVEQLDNGRWEILPNEL